MTEGGPARPRREGTAREVFAVFLRLGLTSFGGPIAHIGYFHRELVERRRWIAESEYGQLLGLSQFLPGPASSQLGFSLGMLRAGWPGALAAFVAFTLPSAVLMVAAASLLPRASGSVGLAAVHGLKLVALAVVAQGVLAMARRLCTDRPRIVIAMLSAGLLIVVDPAWTQMLVVALGGIAGYAFCRAAPGEAAPPDRPPSRPAPAWIWLGLFALLVFGLPIAARTAGGPLVYVDAFTRAGALVFGGGHVVLPLLEESVVRPGWISQDTFLAGYGAAQAVPGPMFTLAAYLGASLPGAAGGIGGAAVALVAIFLPGLLLVAGILPAWRAIAARPGAARVVAGVNAAVVGLLAAALYDPVWTGAVRGPLDVAIALVGFAFLSRRGASAIHVVAWCVAASALRAALL